MWMDASPKTPNYVSHVVDVDGAGGGRPRDSSVHCSLATHQILRVVLAVLGEGHGGAVADDSTRQATLVLRP